MRFPLFADLVCRMHAIILGTLVFDTFLRLLPIEFHAFDSSGVLSASDA